MLQYSEIYSLIPIAQIIVMMWLLESLRFDDKKKNFKKIYLCCMTFWFVI